MTSRTVMATIKRKHILDLLEKGKRQDERKFDEYRPIEMETNFIGTAEGSAKVNVGCTSVVVGVKLEPGEPFPDNPEQGILMTNAEMGPVASPNFDYGPPSQESIEVARVTDRAIREGNVLDLGSLCIEAGKKVWVVHVDIHVLDYDGNLFDACEIGALLALSSATLPAKRFGLGNDVPLELKNTPITCTFVKVGNHVLVDPDLNEEMIADARLSVSLDPAGNVRALQKGLNGGFSLEDIKKIINTTGTLADKIRRGLFQ